MTGYRQDNLVKMSILVNDEPVDALSVMVHRDRAEMRGRAMFEKSKGFEPNKPGITPGVVDNPSVILIDRCKIMKENPPGKDWDGVYVMTSK